MQKKIIKAFLKDDVKNVVSGTPNHIETVISNVFVKGDLVYKIYKSDSHFFNESFYDLSNKQNRHQFTKDDFNWNSALSPEVYLKLHGLSVNDDITLTDDTENAEELVIVMNKLDMNQGVFMRLMRNDLNQDDFYQIGFQLAEREKRLSPSTSERLNLYDDFQTRYEDIKNWLAQAEKYMPLEERETYLTFLKSFIEDNEKVLKAANEYIGIGIDFHAENAVYDNGVLLPIDTYPPKPEWRAGHRHINIYRIATDAFSLDSEKSFRSVLNGYEDANKEKLNSEHERFFVTYAACIMVPYFYMLGEKDDLRKKAAVKSHNFLKKYHGIK